MSAPVSWLRTLKYGALKQGGNIWPFPRHTPETHPHYHPDLNVAARRRSVPERTCVRLIKTAYADVDLCCANFTGPQERPLGRPATRFEPYPAKPVLRGPRWF